MKTQTVSKTNKTMTQAMKATAAALLATAAVLGVGHAAEAKAKATGPAAGNYALDPMHSSVGFEIPHLVVSTVEGKFKVFEGTVDVQPDFAKSKLSATVDIGSIDTGTEKRDDHLKSPDFFDAKKFAKMTFVSTAIKGKPDGFKLEGDLTVRDQKKKVTFDAKYLGAVKDGYGNEKIAFRATTKINRKDFGLTWNSVVEAGPVVGDEVTIELKIQAAKVKQEVKAAAK